MTKTIDEWAAEKCGVELRQIRCGDESRAHMFKLKGKTYWFKWTIEDARCRDKFFSQIIDDGYCVFMEKDSRGACIEVSKRGSEPDTYAYLETTCGKDLEAAVVAAITAIYEAENIQRDI